MCGIAGHITLKSLKPNTRALHAMQNAMKHRGPSGSGEWVKGSVALGMRRLSIIDVAGGDQPLFNEDKTIAIVGNGEIYNYKELNLELKRKKHKPRTGSDIETIAHLYEDYGVDCLQKLRGMFGIALHDTKKHLVLIARDRIGEKPIYWTMHKNGIVFASEMKALLAFPGIKKELRLESIQSFFAFYYIPEPHTLIQGIHKLEAGSYLLIHTKTGEIEQKVYWKANKTKTTKKQNPIPSLKKVLNEISNISLRSDVPVGISLSGGLDSSTVLTLAAKHSKKNLKAFSVGYADRPATDERLQAKSLAEKVGVEFIEREITTEEMVRDFPKTVYSSDDPIADIAAYSIYAVAQLAREHGVPVLLGGVGGDELFWGYPWMRKAAQESFERHEDISFYERTGGFLAGRVFLSLVSTSNLKSHFHDENIYAWKPSAHLHSKIDIGRFSLDAIAEGWLKADCIALGDRMSMAASVELRLPLLDYQLIESVYAHQDTVTGFQQDPKYYLKQAVKGVVPNEILERKKQGFTPPVKEWIFALLEAYLPLIEDGYLVKNQLFSRGALKLFLLTWKINPLIWYQLYCALILEVWCRIFVWGQKPENLAVRA